MNWLVPSVIISAIVALAGVIGVMTGLINIRLTRQRDQVEAQHEEVAEEQNNQQIQNDLVSRAMELLAGQRQEMLAIEQRGIKEAQGLREQVRILEDRIRDLEVAGKQKDQVIEAKDRENEQLKAKLYEWEHKDDPAKPPRRNVRVVPKKAEGAP